MAGPGFQRLVQDARTRVHQFTVEEFVSRLEAGERYILLDVREDAEWVNGHIPSAHHISRGVLEREIERAIPEKNAPIVLYCGGDDRSSPRTISRRWATRTWPRWTEACPAGPRSGCRP